MRHIQFWCVIAVVFFCTSSAYAASGISLGGGYRCSGNVILGSGNRTVKLSTAKQKMNTKIDDLKGRLRTAKNKGQTSKVTSLSQKVSDAKNVRSLLKQCADGKLDSGEGPSKPQKPGRPEKPTRR